ncbi:ABC transporter ATP-binding protein [Mycoplasma sp. E35C]|uniref:ATP-binding cassette domain-containing protein n=1 Tax=Mycoplasma sp. E35C TaxID=2801918 RepID=UPI001CA3933F|nr:ABC transporter ATP-binding protein [Mycoplasma sp. E35C]QZX49013.1 ABC transporter ATP-binding protein [Mycoplasma sp. E35C]
MKYFFFKKHIAKFLLVVFLSFLGNLLLVGGTFLPTYAISSLLKDDFALFGYFILGTILAELFGYFTNYLNHIVKQKYIQSCFNEYRFIFLTQINVYSYQEILKNDSSILHNQINNDLNNFDRYGLSVIFSMIDLSFTAIYSLSFLIYLNWMIALIAIGFLILSFLVPIAFNKYLRKISSNYGEANQKHIQTINKLNKGVSNLFFLNRLDLLIQKMQDNSAWFQKEELIYLKKQSLFAFCISIVSSFSQILLITFALMFAVLYANNPIIPNDFGISAVFSVTSLAGNMYGSFGGIYQGVNKLSVAKKIIKTNLNETKQTKFDPTSTKMLNFNAISFENVNFKFEEKDILTNFNYQFQANKKYLIIGASGSGKSTLINLLMGNYADYEGQIKWDENDIKDINQKEIFNTLNYLQSNPYLFLGTVKDNITYFKENVDDNKLGELKELAKLDFINDYDQQIDLENNFSSGQQQRIAIARHFYNPKPLLIFDEALSHLDKTNANEIENQILKNPNLTFIHISHHIDKEQIKKYDEVINFNELTGAAIC